MRLGVVSKVVSEVADMEKMPNFRDQLLVHHHDPPVAVEG